MFPYEASQEESPKRAAVYELYKNMQLVKVDTSQSPLEHFCVSDIARIIQVQFVLSANCSVGVINRFYNSKIIYSTVKSSRSDDINSTS